MRAWLQSELDKFRTDITAAYLFGSSIFPDQKPRDVDLVVITMDGAGKPSWQRVIAYMGNLKTRFDATFRLPLSIMVVTPSEWREIDGIVVRERVSIF